MTILIFFLVLFVLILVHEWGHFIAAKKTGMRVDEFGIGFPPKLFGIKKGETEYTFNALPIGGFVKIFGENSESSEFSPVASEASDHRSEASAEAGEGGAKSASLSVSGSEEASDHRSEASAEAGEGGAKSASLSVSGSEEASDHRSEASAEAGEGGAKSAILSDSGRSFVSKPKWAQAVVLVAGVTMNIIFAWLLFTIVFMMGVPTSVSEEEATADARLVVTGILPGSPAEEVALSPGAEIVGVSSNGIELGKLTPTGFSDFTQLRSEAELEITYKLGDETLVTAVTPKTGVIADSPDKEAVGVALSMVEEVAKPIHLAIYDATVTTIGSLVGITVGIAGLITDSFQGTADFSQVAGPIGIVGMVGDAAQFGLASLMMFTAIISLNLAVINMFPFPILDGGRLIFVGIEAVTRKPINPVWVQRLNITGFVLLMALMVAVTYNDILRII